MNYCIYLKKRKNKPYCKLLNKEITFSLCRECDKKEYKKKKHNKRTTITQDTYNQVIERDNYSCVLLIILMIYQKKNIKAFYRSKATFSHHHTYRSVYGGSIYYSKSSFISIIFWNIYSSHWTRIIFS